MASYVILQNCEICWTNHVRQKASLLCNECRRPLCDLCSTKHTQKVNHNDFSKIKQTTESEKHIDSDSESSDTESFNSDTNAIKMSKLLLKEVSVKLPDEKDCKINGIACFSTEVSTLLADVENKVLKLFDNNMELKWSVAVSRHCVGITVLSESSFATIEGKKLQFWTLEMNQDEIVVPKPSHDIDLQHSGFAIHSNGNYVGVLESSDGLVQIFDLFGDEMYSVELKTVSTKPITPGFTFLMDSELDRFYISDRDYVNGTKLICVTYRGDLVWDCPIPASVGGMTECDNLLFVVSIGYAKIHMITKDGIDVGTLVSDEGKLPFHICSQPLEKTLLVSHNFTGNDRNLIRIYNLSDILYEHSVIEKDDDDDVELP